MSLPVDDSLANLTADQKRALLAQLMAKKQLMAKNQRHNSVPQPPTSHPMSAGQQGLWYAFRRDPQHTAYNVFMPSRFRSPVDLRAMRQVINELVQRHSALRTVFGETPLDSRPVARIQKELPPEFVIEQSAGMDDEQLTAAVRNETQRPFDLTTGPMLRVKAFQVAPDDVVMVATTHHIVVDFWSLILMMNEVRSSYQQCVVGQSTNLPPAPSNYHQFVANQSALIDSVQGQRLADYWTVQLQDVRWVLDWPTDFKRPAKFTHRAAVRPIEFSRAAGASISSLAKRLAVTPNVVVMAMLQTLVARFSQQDSFSIGTPFSGRSGREFESTVGFFVNVLPITADLADNPTFAALVKTLGRRMVDALEHEALPFSEIVRNVAPGRDPSRHPLFQVSCTFEKSQVASERGRAGFLLGGEQSFSDFAGMKQESFFIEHPTCHYDMEFIFEIEGDDASGMICYCRDLFDAGTIDSLAREMASLAERLVQQPNVRVKSIAWHTEQSATRVKKPVQNKTTSIQSRDLIPNRATRLLHAGPSDARLVAAHQFAEQLADAGLSAGQIVPVVMPRGADAWIGILGVMLAGGTPVPIDAAGPAVEFETLAADICGANGGEQDALWLVSELEQTWAPKERVKLFAIEDHSGSGTRQEFRQERAPSNVLTTSATSNLAYVIYTSGSTGAPKGVMVPHRGIANTLRWRDEAVTLTSDDRVLILLSHQFDAAMAIVMTTWLQSATPVWPTTLDLDIDALIEQIITQQITILPAIPSLLSVLVAHPKFDQCTSIRQVWSGGESIRIELVTELIAKLGCEVWNFYGPTECSVEATAIRLDHLDPHRSLPIGHPIGGTEIWILDDGLAPVPVGIAGQIAVSGIGLANGYLNRPDQTAQAFVTSKQLLDADAQPRRLYLTGDRGRRRSDGSIEFFGRLDNQVKVRGFRVELEDIEQAIGSHHQVEQVAVKVAFQGTPREQLAAYVVGRPELDLAELRRHVNRLLPPFKRPGSINRMTSLPSGTNGKVQRECLPDPVPNKSTFDSRSGSLELGREARTCLEIELQQQFADALDRNSTDESIGIDDNFFELGGTSLQAAVLTSRLSAKWEIAVPTALLFDLGDIASVAARLAALYPDQLRNRFGDQSVSTALAESHQADSSLLVDWGQRGGVDEHPLLMVHPPGGMVLCYRELAQHLSTARRLVAIRSRGLHGDEDLPPTMAAMASDYVQAIRKKYPNGPYWIGGWSLGGVIAFEVARQLVASGEQVAGLVLLDSTIPESSDRDAPSAGQEYGIELSLSQLSELSADDQLPMLYEHAEKLGVLNDETPKEVAAKVIADLQTLFAHHVRLCETYSLQHLDVPVLLIRPDEVPGEADPRPDRGWHAWTSSVQVTSATGHHHSMVQMPGVDDVAKAIAAFTAKRDVNDQRHDATP